MENSQNFKIIKLFPSLIKREPELSQECDFAKYLSYNLLDSVFQFLTFDEILKISTLNIYLYNAFARRQHKIKNAIIPLSRKLNFQYSYDEEKDQIKEFNNDGIFEMDVDQKGMYIQIKDGNITYYSIAYYYDWSDKALDSEWFMSRCINPIICDKTPHLFLNWPSDFNFWFDCIYEGRYKFYLYHYIEKDDVPYNLTIMLGERQIYSGNYPNIDIPKKQENEEYNYFNEPDQRSFREFCDFYGSYFNKGMNNLAQIRKIEDEKRSKNITLIKELICEFSATKDDLFGCERGQILFVQFTAIQPKEKFNLYMHGAILERTDVKIEI